MKSAFEVSRKPGFRFPWVWRCCEIKQKGPLMTSVSKLYWKNFFSCQYFVGIATFGLCIVLLFGPCNLLPKKELHFPLPHSKALAERIFDILTPVIITLSDHFVLTVLLCDFFSFWGRNRSDTVDFLYALTWWTI